MPSHRALRAALVAALSGYAVFTVEDGGGSAALLIAEVCCSSAAVAVALS
ncbi:MAG: hypothetical protein LH654_05875 [Thermoleophilia bacterium]|nr:hypothetical protein [Thermoleophilia bacterium]